ncbi:MAG TPA: carotenoid oxygenase family protein [Acidimicrobiia bacterium]|nr:carotenoid oxygenase family protein [Acidimicrobiia bacterium]
MDRRTVLRLGGLGALGLAVAACSSGRSGSSAAPPSTTTPFTSPPLDPAKPWWLQGNYAPVTREVEATTLSVQGSLPKELSGLYVRNGSNPKPGWAPHWFLGDGMVHGVVIEDGKATWYRNRYVDTALLAAGGGLTASGAPGGAAGLSNVSVVHHAGKLLTLGEVGLPYEISPSDLSTVGVYDFSGKLAGNMTAHPKIDPATGHLHFFGYNFSEPYLAYHVADDTGVLLSSQAVPVKKSTMIHDFAITDRDVIFWEMPVLFDMKLAVQMVSEEKSTIMPYVWTPSYGSRVGIMPLGGPASEIRWIEIDNCYVFHGMNAFRDGDNVVVDVSRLASAFNANSIGPPPALHRWTINTAGKDLTFKDEQRTDTRADLPSIDKRHTGRDYTHGWRVVTRESSETNVDFGGVVHINTKTKAESQWDPGLRYSSGEWLFVPTGDAEGEGVIMTFVHDKADDKTSLTVLDARDVAAGPMARVELPQRVPYGFHAAFVPATPA